LHVADALFAIKSDASALRQLVKIDQSGTVIANVSLPATAVGLSLSHNGTTLLVGVGSSILQFSLTTLAPIVGEFASVMDGSAQFALWDATRSWYIVYGIDSSINYFDQGLVNAYARTSTKVSFVIPLKLGKFASGHDGWIEFQGLNVLGQITLSDPEKLLTTQAPSSGWLPMCDPHECDGVCVTNPSSRVTQCVANGGVTYGGRCCTLDQFPAFAKFDCAGANGLPSPHQFCNLTASSTIATTSGNGVPKSVSLGASTSSSTSTVHNKSSRASSVRLALVAIVCAVISTTCN
jgi:hypothetical protein